MGTVCPSVSPVTMEWLLYGSKSMDLQSKDLCNTVPTQSLASSP